MGISDTTPPDPHAAQPLIIDGPMPEEAALSLILIHGRGSSAESILSLYHELALPGVSAIAPQAFASSWYPQSFLAPIESNQPFLNSALGRLESLVIELNNKGVPTSRIAILGFSQGACLTLEYIARNPRRYGAIMALTGGLIGPEGTKRDYEGSLNGTPVFLGTSDPDPHVPLQRVVETKTILARMDASVELRSYPGMPHTINKDELETCRAMLKKAFAPPES